MVDYKFDLFMKYSRPLSFQHSHVERLNVCPALCPTPLFSFIYKYCGHLLTLLYNCFMNCTPLKLSAFWYPLIILKGSRQWMWKRNLQDSDNISQILTFSRYVVENCRKIQHHQSRHNWKSSTYQNNSFWLQKNGIYNIQQHTHCADMFWRKASSAVLYLSVLDLTTSLFHKPHVSSRAVAANNVRFIRSNTPTGP